MSGTPDPIKKVRLQLINTADKSQRNDEEHSYPDRPKWKEAALKDIRALATHKSIAHEKGCDALNRTDLAETVGDAEDSVGALFVFRCPCGQAEVLVVQLN